MVSNLFAGPYAATTWGAVIAPALIGLYWAINSSEKERNRRGLHPVTKWTVGVFMLVLAFAAGIVIGQS